MGHKKYEMVRYKPFYTIDPNYQLRLLPYWRMGAGTAFCPAAVEAQSAQNSGESPRSFFKGQKADMAVCTPGSSASSRHSAAAAAATVQATAQQAPLSLFSPFAPFSQTQSSTTGSKRTPSHRKYASVARCRQRNHDAMRFLQDVDKELTSAGVAHREQPYSSCLGPGSHTRPSPSQSGINNITRTPVRTPQHSTISPSAQSALGCSWHSLPSHSDAIIDQVDNQWMTKMAHDREVMEAALNPLARWAASSCPGSEDDKTAQAVREMLYGLRVTVNKVFTRMVRARAAQRAGRSTATSNGLQPAVPSKATPQSRALSAAQSAAADLPSAPEANSQRCNLPRWAAAPQSWTAAATAPVKKADDHTLCVSHSSRPQAAPLATGQTALQVSTGQDLQLALGHAQAAASGAANKAKGLPPGFAGILVSEGPLRQQRQRLVNAAVAGLAGPAGLYIPSRQNVSSAGSSAPSAGSTGPVLPGACSKMVSGSGPSTTPSSGEDSSSYGLELGVACCSSSSSSSSSSSIDGRAGLDVGEAADQGLGMVALSKVEGAGLGLEQGQPVALGYQYFHKLLCGFKGQPVVAQPQRLGYKYLHKLLCGYKGPVAMA
jgi:hypothetical protein